MTMVITSDGLILVNTDDKFDQFRWLHGNLILMTMVISSDGFMVVNTDDKGDQFRWPHGS